MHFYCAVTVLFNILITTLLVDSRKYVREIRNSSETMLNTGLHTIRAHFHFLKPNEYRLNVFNNRPFLHINHKNINYSKRGTGIYSKYYNNEPIFNTYNPILNYDVLDIIKVYGRFADHAEHESLHINIKIKSETPETLSALQRFCHVFKNKRNRNSSTPIWFNHFLKQGKMNFTEFKNALVQLKFKWPKDTLLITYSVFLFEKGLNKYADSPLIRKKVEHYMQYQDINPEVLKSCFYAFSSNKEYITVFDILDTFRKWNKQQSVPQKKENKKFFFFKNWVSKKQESQNNEYINWITFKKNIDASTVERHEVNK